MCSKTYRSWKVINFQLCRLVIVIPFEILRLNFLFTMITLWWLRCMVWYRVRVYCKVGRCALARPVVTYQWPSDCNARRPALYFAHSQPAHYQYIIETIIRCSVIKWFSDELRITWLTHLHLHFFVLNQIKETLKSLGRHLMDKTNRRCTDM